MGFMSAFYAYFFRDDTGYSIKDGASYGNGLFRTGVDYYLRNVLCRCIGGHLLRKYHSVYAICFLAFRFYPIWVVGGYKLRTTRTRVV